MSNIVFTPSKVRGIADDVFMSGRAMCMGYPVYPTVGDTDVKAPFMVAYRDNGIYAPEMAHLSAVEYLYLLLDGTYELRCDGGESTPYCYSNTAQWHDVPYTPYCPLSHDSEDDAFYGLKVPLTLGGAREWLCSPGMLYKKDPATEAGYTMMGVLLRLVMHRKL